MKKNLTKFLAMTLCILMSIVCVSCSGGGGTRVIEPGTDPTDKRPSMYVSVFNGGYGRAWLDTIVNDFNKEYPDNKYKVVVRANKDEFASIKSGIMSGTFTPDMFFSNLYIHQLISGGYLENISDVWTSDPDGDGSTIESLMYNSDTYKQAYGDGKGGLYALPLQESLRSFVYDHDLFLEYKLLFNEKGDFISSKDEKLSKGKDGVEGTYDDGQPITEAQWEAMCTKAKTVYGNIFTYTGKFSVYLNDLYYMLFAQYDGVDAFNLNRTFDGSYTFAGDSEPTTINLNNAYTLVEQAGRKMALEWLDKWLAVKDAALGITNPWINPKSGNLSYSHTDAQNDYLISAAQNKANKSAMLIEGDYWENEAKTTFNALAEDAYDDYAFRTRNYRYMTLPIFKGQKAKGNVYSIADNMYISVVKQTDSNKKQICHDFVKYMYKDKYIQNFTVESGGVMPYNVELTESQKTKLSPFTKNFLDLYKDKENNEFINYNLNSNISPIAKSGAFPSITAFGDGYVIMNGLYTKSATEMLDAMRTLNAQEKWGDCVISYNKYLETLNK